MEDPAAGADRHRSRAVSKEQRDHRDVGLRHRITDGARTGEHWLVREQQAQRFELPTDDRMMDRRDLERVDRRVACLRERWLA